jgi:hypothetical protein
MLTAAFLILTAAVLIGTLLAILHARGEAALRVPWPAGVLHGLIGIAGFVCLLLALRGPPRGLDEGMASFGMIGAVLIALAALAGLAILATFRMKRQGRAGTLIGIHATLAISGFVILAAYVFAG